jgi:uncharacterized membrane protein YhaH (DUF805 family)
MHWMLMPLRRYAEFSGRSRRKEFWMWVLFTTIVNSVLMLLGFWGAEERLFSSEEELMLYFACTIGLFALATFIPNLALVVRRLHDTDRSGWNILFGLIPIVGGFILLYFYVSEGTRGPNRFGADPKGADAAAFA